MARLIWTERSLADLESLLEYIEADAPAIAQRFAQRIVDKAELLQGSPLLGSFIVEDETQTYREVLQGSYRIIYRVESDYVYIITVFHAARLLNKDELG